MEETCASQFGESMEVISIDDEVEERTVCEGKCSCGESQKGQLALELSTESVEDILLDTMLAHGYAQNKTTKPQQPTQDRKGESVEKSVLEQDGRVRVLGQRLRRPGTVRWVVFNIYLGESSLCHFSIF